MGRGSFTESFPLFGYALTQYEQLFTDKLDLFAKLIEGGPVTWQGETRAALTEQRVYSEIESPPLRTWIGVGGSPKSVVRAARYGLPMMLVIIGGQPARFRPYVDLYRRTLDELGKPQLPIGVHSPGHVAETDEKAREELWPNYKVMLDGIGRERGWPPLERARFDHEADRGALNVGSPETVAKKIAETIEALGVARFDLKYSAGALPHDTLMRSIELYATQVVPMVRERLAKKR